MIIKHKILDKRKYGKVGKGLREGIDFMIVVYGSELLGIG